MTTTDPQRDPNPTIWLHGLPARDLDQVRAYLNGDAHDQSKVQVLVNGHFYNLADMVSGD
jgi:hypothetical protein